MSKQKHRLFGLEIDEVSAVDRPANQLGLISIAKALGDPEEGAMSEAAVEDVLTDAPFTHGQELVDDEGNEFIYVELDENDEPLPLEGVDLSGVTVEADDVVEPADDQEPAEVGKAVDLSRLRELGSTMNTGRKMGAGGIKGRRTRTVLSHSGDKAGVAAHDAGVRVGEGQRWMRKNPGKTAAVGATAAGLAGGGAYMEAKKSLGTTVLEALSKAVTDDDRDQVIAKALDEVEITKAENAELREMLEGERDIRITEAFVAKAAEYSLPAKVTPEVFGPILKGIAEVLTDDELDVLDEVLSSRGVDIYDELGFTGGASNSSVLDEVSGLTAELVGKSAGTITPEMASTAIFETNPAAYDEYLAEQNGR
jgi:hypothetical protein